MSAPDKPGLVALRDRRDEVIQALTDAFAADLFDLDEFDRRVDLAHRAQEVAVLDELVADLDLPTPDTALTVRSNPALAVSRPRSRWSVAIMGGVERKGSWRVPATLKVLTLMGGASLDFRECELPPGETTVRVFTLMGGAEIIVPPHLAVECDGISIMGGFETMDRAPVEPDPDRPLLRITGFALMGGVSVETRLPGESSREARRRRKRERKQKRRELEGRQRRQLGDGEG